MTTMKYPIKEVNIEAIQGNRVLGIGASKNQKALCAKSIRQYGLVMPIVTVEKPSGGLMVLKGDNELAVLKEMKVDKTDVFVTSIKDAGDIGKAILLLSSLQKELNHISEGLILKEILEFKKYNQKQLAAQLMKSESWISKRLSLAEHLNDNVAAMVMSKELCPSIAQNIARLPKDKQHTFAMNVYSNNISKSAVEKLVGAYSNKNTPDAFKEEIIHNPLMAMDKISPVGVRKINNESDKLLKFQNALRLMLKLTDELEAMFAVLEQDKLEKHVSLILAVEGTLAKFLSLVKQWRISPGKFDHKIEENRGCYP